MNGYLIDTNVALLAVFHSASLSTEVRDALERGPSIARNAGILQNCINIVASRLDSARCFSTTTPSPSPVPYGDFFSRWFGSTVRQFMRNPRAIWNCAPVMCKTPVPGIRTAWISPVVDPHDPIPGRPEFFVSNSP